FEIKIEDTDEALILTVDMGNDPEFIYAVHPVSTEQPEFGPSDTPVLDENKKATYYRAEVHLSEGGQNYDIMGWSKISVINDVIDHYHKHQHFIHLLK
ncbi:MAG: choline transporter, partial [Pseudomonadota bacterium]|nr:choline transporter [Pseudomonadota bacterium]